MIKRWGPPPPAAIEARQNDLFPLSAESTDDGTDDTEDTGDTGNGAGTTGTTTSTGATVSPTKLFLPMMDRMLISFRNYSLAGHLDLAIRILPLPQAMETLAMGMGIVRPHPLGTETTETLTGTGTRTGTAMAMGTAMATPTTTITTTMEALVFPASLTVSLVVVRTRAPARALRALPLPPAHPPQLANRFRLPLQARVLLPSSPQANRLLPRQTTSQ